MTWYAVTVTPLKEEPSSDEFDTICSELIEHGACGTAIDQAPLITCYLEGDSQALDNFTAKIPTLGCRLIETAEVLEENWTGACPDVWEPIKAGSVEVVPVQSPDDPRPAPSGAIKIIPGLGFGTGHHATTRMVLTELSNLIEANPHKKYSVLDLGTGSGILAIAAAILLNTPIEAIDNDPLALENARDNVALNNVEELVRLSTTPLDQLQGAYDLILANVYGEVLTALAPEITRVAKPGAVAILSGITEIVWDSVWLTYDHHDWKLLKEYGEQDWMCAVIQRKP
jgi:ribosomal protein L11 methyltransferase